MLLDKLDLERSLVPEAGVNRSSPSSSVTTSTSTGMRDSSWSQRVGETSSPENTGGGKGGESHRIWNLTSLDGSSESSQDSVSSSWFLKSEAWAIHHQDLARHAHPDSKTTVFAFKSFIQSIKQWVQQWIECSYCPFIHEHLFAQTGLPQCLQDAYATWTVYSGKNEMNEEIVLQLVEDRANSLVRQQEEQMPLTDSQGNTLYEAMGIPVLQTIDHLARVQALAIYQLIRLYDGDIRQRAQAERHIDTLTNWTRQLWQSANLDASLQTTFGDGAAISQIWRDWILAESVRRTWMVANYTQSIYLTLRDGLGPCEGIINFTARRGLWDATSAAAWFRIVKYRDPLFLPCYQTLRLLDKMATKDIDDFGMSIITTMWDLDKFATWVAKQPELQMEAILKGCEFDGATMHSDILL
ncbi:Fc.00g088150.m01.CDS01 [Cosmosporella sp. VM-42]